MDGGNRCIRRLAFFISIISIVISVGTLLMLIVSQKEVSKINDASITLSKGVDRIALSSGINLTMVKADSTYTDTSISYDFNFGSVDALDTMFAFNNNGNIDTIMHANLITLPTDSNSKFTTLRYSPAYNGSIDVILDQAKEVEKTYLLTLPEASTYTMDPIYVRLLYYEKGANAVYIVGPDADVYSVSYGEDDSLLVVKGLNNIADEGFTSKLLHSNNNFSYNELRLMYKSTDNKMEEYPNRRYLKIDEITDTSTAYEISIEIADEEGLNKDSKFFSISKTFPYECIERTDISSIVLYK